MSFKMYMNEFQESFQETFETNKQIKNSLPSHLGKGYTVAQSLNDAVFTEQCFNFSQDLLLSSVDHHSDKDGCAIMFILEGESSFQVNNKSKDYQLLKNNAILASAKGEQKYNINIKKNKLRQYSFNFSQDTLLEHLIEFDDTQLINQVQNNQQFNFFKQIKLSPTHHYLIEKMIKNPYNGSLKNIYFESCANELMIALLRDLSTKKVYELVLNDGDKERLIKAKNILLKDLQNPPTIEALAKKVALNQDKLKKGFKSIFGNTVFGTLTQERMKVAYADLQRNDLSITEVGRKTGYINVSNFILVFKKQFGKTPGQMRKEKSFYWFE